MVNERDAVMATEYLTQPLEVGTYVRIVNSRYGISRIVEYRGKLGPNGARVYLVEFRPEPDPAYTEVLEEQLEVVSPQ